MDISKWQPPQLTTVIEYDPFAIPASFPRPQPTDVEAALARLGDHAGEQELADGASMEDRMKDSQAELETLRQLGVQVVLGQRDQYVALIGDRTVRVGDEINGFTVIAIDSDGVRVARDLKR
jgi:hypothetical protein